MFESPLLLILGTAFIAGFIAQRLNLPALVGFLLAGFGLQVCGIQSCTGLEQLAELGVIVLLFTIGLKLDIRQIFRREIVWGTFIQTLFSTLGLILLLALLNYWELPYFKTLNKSQWGLLAVALSFSSTVLAVKSMQEKGEFCSCYGRLCLGILVIQDILAILFLTFSTGKMPSLWAVVLFLLPLLRPFLFRLLHLLGHDEILILGSLVLALLPGALLFHICGLEAELGALVSGMLIASHPRASEISKSLFSLKELFLVCFFVHIGLAETPNWECFHIALILLLFLPVKAILYYLTTRLFLFRARTGLQTAITLCNFSEFGLIVGDIAVKQGLLGNHWLVILALATALSFLIAVPLNRLSDPLYLLLTRWGIQDDPLKLHPEDQFIDPGSAKILIFGMGHVGTCAYDELHQRYGDIILGIEHTSEHIQHHQSLGRNVIGGDATDPEFWRRIIPKPNIHIILLAIPHWRGNQIALQQIKKSRFSGKTAAIVRYEDEITELQALGVDAAFSIYHEAGSGFARHVISTFNTDRMLAEDHIKQEDVLDQHACSFTLSKEEQRDECL